MTKTATDDIPCAMEELESLWTDLEDHERFKFQSFCDFFSDSWRERARRWDKAEKAGFLYGFNAALHERVDEASFLRPFRGTGRSRLVEHDPVADALRVCDLVPKSFQAAYRRLFPGRWQPRR